MPCEQQRQALTQADAEYSASLAIEQEATAALEAKDAEIAAAEQAMVELRATREPIVVEYHAAVAAADEKFTVAIDAYGAYLDCQRQNPTEPVPEVPEALTKSRRRFLVRK